MTTGSLELPSLTVLTNFATGNHTDLSASSSPKFSLAFILDDCNALLSHKDISSSESTLQSSHRQRKRNARALSTNKKRAARQCSIETCFNYIIDRGLCFRHGGGKSCSKTDCSASAKHHGLCWKHGGSTLCTVKGCSRGTKSRGLCWSHGGGTKCSATTCQKTAISKGLCWTHGGGKRCASEGCKRPASQSKHNLCSKHQPERGYSGILKSWDAKIKNVYG